MSRLLKSRARAASLAQRGRRAFVRRCHQSADNVYAPDMTFPRKQCVEQVAPRLELLFVKHPVPVLIKEAARGGRTGHEATILSRVVCWGNAAYLKIASSAGK